MATKQYVDYSTNVVQIPRREKAQAYMRKIDYSEKAMELADQLLAGAADLKKLLLKQAREERAHSSRGGFRLLGGSGGSAGGPSKLVDDDFQGIKVRIDE